MSFAPSSSTLQNTITSITSLPTPISSSSPISPTTISSSPSDNKLQCSISCYVTTAIILILLIVCLILLRLSYIYLHKRRRTSVVDIESNTNNNIIINIDDDNNNNNIHNNEILSTTRLNNFELFGTGDTLFIPQNALIRNRHTISVRTHSIHTSSNNLHHSPLKRTRTTISSYIISNNNINDNTNLRNDIIKNFMLDKNIINNNIDILVEKFPLPPPLLSSNQKNDVDKIIDELSENIKKFNKPWEFAPEVASKEMNTIKVKNGGRIIEINPESWSSVVKEASVQSNYPFYVPLPCGTPKKVVDEKVEEVDKKVYEKADEKVDEKVNGLAEIDESLSDKIRKKLQKKKRLQQLITRKSSKIEETKEEYKDGEGFDYFEITILEKENPNTNIAIGVATKPFPCYR
jgi:hypothetical protein